MKFALSLPVEDGMSLSLLLKCFVRAINEIQQFYKV